MPEDKPVYPTDATDAGAAVEYERVDDVDEGLGDDTAPRPAGEDSDEESYLDPDSFALWEGDQGTLDARQRDTLVALLKKAFISSDDRAEWRTLTRNPDPIRTNLNNLYFNLVIDPRSEVAYASPARTADNPFKTLVRDAPNNREETLLLIYLRERFRSATANAEPYVYADTLAMYDYVQRFRPDSATDKVADERRVTNAIAGLLTAGLLVRTSDEGRYRVHRAIEALLPLPKLTQLVEAFKRLNAGQHDTEPDTYTGKHAARATLDVLDDLAGLDDVDGRDPGFGTGFDAVGQETA